MKLPLTEYQREFYLGQIVTPADPIFNIGAAVYIRGPLDLAKWRAAVADVAAARPVLGSVVHEHSGEPFQVFGYHDVSRWPIVDLTSTPDATRAVEEHIAADFGRAIPFGPAHRLMEQVLYRLTPDRWLWYFKFHHILLDGWATSLLYKQYVARYTDLCDGTAEPLAASDEYRAFVEQDVNYTGSAEYQEDKRYWLERLQDPPNYFPAKSGSARQSRRRQVSLPRALMERISRACADKGVTRLHFFLGILMAALEPRVGEPDLLVGIPMLNRRKRSVRDTIGLFANMAPFRLRSQPDKPFAGVMGDVAKQLRSDYRHSRCAPAGLFRRDGGEVLQVTLSFEAHDYHIDCRHCTNQVRVLHSPSQRRPLQVFIREYDPRYPAVMDLDYNPSYISEQEAQELAGVLEELITDFADDPSRSIARERSSQHWVAWNQTQRTYELSPILPELFERQVAKTPDAVAVAYGREQLSYDALNRRANHVAWYLRGLGIGVEAPVGLYARRSPAAISGMLGILKAGGVYVPLDPAYPRERLEFMLRDCEARVVVTAGGEDEQWLHALAEVVRVDDARLLSELPGNPDRIAGPDHLAYVLYTSGSTGRPKGVGGVHLNTVNRCAWMWDTYPYESGEVACQKTSLNFIDSVAEMMGPLLQGIKTVILADDVVKDAERFVQELEAQKVTRLVLVPSLLKAMLNAQEGSGERLAGMKYVISSGEALEGGLWERFSAHMEKSRLINLYGSSEVAGDVTCHEVGAGSGARIGRPIANTQVYVLDEEMKPAPVARKGELYIGGAAIARGYVNRPELTAERFVPNPFGVGARLYRSGDVGRWTHDGELEYLGRCDQQLKIRGYRIEPGEIETVLRQQAGVQQSVVVAREDRAAGGARLVAYVVGPEESDVPRLRQALQRKLPEYMIPSMIVPLTELPLTPNGKLERLALPMPEVRASVGPERGLTPDEEMLTAIWCELLGLERVALDDNFFDIGGHSLLATQLATRIMSVFQIDTPLRAIFESPTLAGLVEYIEQHRNAGWRVPAIERQDEHDRARLSYAQQRLWFVDRLDGGRGAYNVPTVTRILGALNVAALRRSFSEIVKRHEVLRSSYSADGSEVRQHVSPAVPIPVPLMDLSELGPVSQKRLAEEISRREAGAPFDLERGPVARFQLLRFSARDHLLLVTIHHIACDAWSMEVLLREFAVAYRAFAIGITPELPELRVQYADYAAWQHAWVESDAVAGQFDYWNRQLAHVPRLTLPAAPSLGEKGAPVITLALDASFVERLRAFGRKEQVTLFMTTLAAVDLLLKSYTGQDVVVGTDVADRRCRETEALVGCFVNQLAMRTSLEGNPTVRELLARVRTTALEAYAAQDLPFERLVRLVNPKRRRGQHPLFQAKLILTPAPRPFEVDGVTFEAVEVPPRDNGMDLGIAMIQWPQRIAVYLSSGTGAFGRKGLEDAGAHYVAMLDAMMREPERDIAGLLREVGSLNCIPA